MSTVSEICVDPERKNHEGEQYLYDGITGRYTYYPAGTFPDKAKLAELNAEQRKVYRDRQNLLFPRIGKRREGLVVVSEVDDIEANDASEKDKGLDDYEENRAYVNECRRKLRIAKTVLEDLDYQIYRKVVVLKLISFSDFARETGLPIPTVWKRAARAKALVDEIMKKPK